MLSEQRLRTVLTDNRSVVIIASLFIQISLGVNYSFPTIIPFLTSQYDWTTKETQAVWSCVTIVVGLAPMLASFLLKFYSFRFLTTCTSLLMFFGYTIASLCWWCFLHQHRLGSWSICGRQCGNLLSSCSQDLSHLLPKQERSNFWPRCRYVW
ncbi:hypothetical protein GEMRC1_005204 [Eukaryota sp. GEM-RC1]